MKSEKNSNGCSLPTTWQIWRCDHLQARYIQSLQKWLVIGLPVNEADLGHSHQASNWPIRGATNERSLLSAAWKINASTFALHLASRSSSNSWLLQLLQLWPRLTTEFGWNPTASRTLAPDQFIANAAIPVLHFLAGHAEPWKTHKIWLWPMFYAKQPFCTKYLQNPTNTGLKCITWHLMTKHLNLVMSRVNLKMWPRAFAKDWINVDLVDPLQLIRPHMSPPSPQHRWTNASLPAPMTAQSQSAPKHLRGLLHLQPATWIAHCQRLHIKFMKCEWKVPNKVSTVWKGAMEF